jgi:hypothetical protein
VGERAARLVTTGANPFVPLPMRVLQSWSSSSNECLATTPLTIPSPNNGRLSPRFTDKWKARLRHPSVPPEALPPVLKHTFDTADANKERYRRATCRQSMVHAPSPADEGVGLNPGSMPRKIRNTVFGGRLADRAEHGSSASAKVAPK